MERLRARGPQAREVWVTRRGKRSLVGVARGPCCQKRQQLLSRDRISVDGQLTELLTDRPCSWYALGMACLERRQGQATFLIAGSFVDDRRQGVKCTLQYCNTLVVGGHGRAARRKRDSCWLLVP